MIQRDAFAQYLDLRRGGGGRAYPPVVDINSATPIRGAGLGERVKLRGATSEGGGNEFIVVQAAEAITKNRVVAWEADVTCTVAPATGVLGDGIIPIDTVASFAANGARGAFAFVPSATDVFEIHVIVASDTTWIQIANRQVQQTPGLASGGIPWDADKLAQTLAHDATFLVRRPFRIVTAATRALTASQAGICPCNLSSGYFGLLQVKGFAKLEASGALAAGSLDGNLDTGVGDASTADTGSLLSGVFAEVITATSGVGVAAAEIDFPLCHPK